MHTGLQGTHDFIVTKAHLASSVGSGQVDVLATPMMITAMEYTAAASAAPVLEAGRTTVGTQISVSHIAATPEGMNNMGSGRQDAYAADTAATAAEAAADAASTGETASD